VCVVDAMCCEANGSLSSMCIQLHDKATTKLLIWRPLRHEGALSLLVMNVIGERVGGGRDAHRSVVLMQHTCTQHGGV
jgi:hypothetical protein